MSRRSARLLPVVGVLFVASSSVLFWTFSYPMSQIVANAAWVGTGAFLVTRRAGGVVGPILMAIGVGWNMAIAADIGAESLFDSGNESAAGWLALIFTVATIPLLWLIVPMLLLFPEGRNPSPRIRRLLQVSAGYAALVTVVQVFARPTVMDPASDGWPHPFLGDDIAESVQEVAIGLALPILLLQILAAAIVLSRLRRSDPLERRQLAWVSVAIVVYVVVSLFNVFVNPLGSEDRANLLVDAIGFTLLPLAVGVAILRYRLYDIDVVISKSVTYLGLAAAITALYAAVVVGPLLLIGATDEEGPGLLLPIVATAVVALLFEPIRKRMQRWANRLVYGERASPHEVLSRVTARLSDAPGSAGMDDLARLLAEGTGADRAVVWMRSGEILRAEGMWSKYGLESSLPLMTEALVVDDFTEAVSVRHEGEELGALSISKPHNDPVTPADRELLGDVAAGAALVLRNMRLNRELEERADDVRESRRRLIAAQDAERHRLERDLHDGAQQQVVALKVKLGIAKTLAQREGADEIATRVIALADETQHAVDALREVAHGIYPPLLESEGLQPALRAVERSSSIPLELDVAGLERYARPTEETVYFCVLETLEKARMSGATSAQIVVTGRNGDLVTEIGLRSMVTELDLRAVADRLDAAGGTLAIEDQPERGRCVVSSLPVAPIEGAKT